MKTIVRLLYIGMFFLFIQCNLSKDTIVPTLEKPVENLQTMEPSIVTDQVPVPAMVSVEFLLINKATLEPIARPSQFVVVSETTKKKQSFDFESGPITLSLTEDCYVIRVNVASHSPEVIPNFCIQNEENNTIIKKIYLEEYSLSMVDSRTETIKKKIKKKVQPKRVKKTRKTKTNNEGSTPSTVSSSVVATTTTTHSPTAPVAVVESIPTMHEPVVQANVASPTQPPLPSLENIEANSINTITTGKFKYDKIPPLPVDTNYLFKLEIIPSQDTTLFSNQNSEPSETVEETIQVGSEMTVHISTRPEDFEIRRISDSIQPIDPVSSTIWSWMVVPKRAGKHPVTVSIDILTKSPLTGDLRKKSIEVFNREVDVFVVEKTTAEKIKDPINWMWASIPIALLTGGIFFFLSKRKKEEEVASWAKDPQTPAVFEDWEKQIAKGKTEKTILSMMDFFKGKDTNAYKMLLTLSAEYNQYEKEFNMGLNPPKDQLNRINYSLIDIMKDLKRQIV